MIVCSPDAMTRSSRAAPVIVALRRFVGCGDRDVERGVEVVPGGLRVGDADRPRDGGVVGGDLADDVAGRVVAVDPEAGGLTGDRPAGVLEPVGRHRQRAGQLGAEEEAVGAVADPGDADRRVDGDRHDAGERIVWWRGQRAARRSVVVAGGEQPAAGHDGGRRRRGAREERATCVDLRLSHLGLPRPSVPRCGGRPQLPASDAYAAASRLPPRLSPTVPSPILFIT